MAATKEIGDIEAEKSFRGDGGVNEIITLRGDGVP